MKTGQGIKERAPTSIVGALFFGGEDPSGIVGVWQPR